MFTKGKASHRICTNLIFMVEFNFCLKQIQQFCCVTKYFCYKHMENFGNTKSFYTIMYVCNLEIGCVVSDRNSKSTQRYEEP